MTSFKPSPVAQALQQQRLNELMSNENQLANSVTAKLGYSRGDPGNGWRPFAMYCDRFGVSLLPAKPSTVAAYVLYLGQLGKHFDDILVELSSIADLHDQNVGNPVATGLVNAALTSIATPEQVKPPHSWKADEQAMFWYMPTLMQAVIARRDLQREKHLHNQGNELGELRKRIKDYEIQENANSGNDTDAKNIGDTGPDQGAGATKEDHSISKLEGDRDGNLLRRPAPRRGKRGRSSAESHAG